MFRGGDFSGSNRPNRLVSDDDVRPVGDLCLDGGELAEDDLESVVGFSLFEFLSDTSDDVDSGFEGVSDLLSDEL